jgi:hypothetical protein
MRLFERNPARHAQFNLGSQPSPAKKPKPGTDTFGTLAHSLEPPVTITPPLKFLRINPTPIITHSDAQFGSPKLDLRLDISCMGMAVGIYNRFTANTVNFIARAGS